MSERQWRREAQIRGVQANLQSHINGSTNGATCEIPLGTARALIGICEQLRRLERNQENPEC